MRMIMMNMISYPRTGGTMNSDEFAEYLNELTISSRLKWARTITEKLAAVQTTRVHKKNGLLSVILTYIRIFSDKEYVKSNSLHKEFDAFTRAISSVEKFLMEEHERRSNNG